MENRIICDICGGTITFSIEIILAKDLFSEPKYKTRFYHICELVYKEWECMIIQDTMEKFNEVVRKYSFKDHFDPKYLKRLLNQHKLKLG